jgi:YggT family protein
MSYFAQAGVILLEFAFGLLATLFVLRVALPLARANFYNPICQFVYRASHAVVTPLRRVLRPIGRFETSAAVVAWLLMVLKAWLVQALMGRALGVSSTLVLGLAGLVELLISLVFLLVLARVILSFVGPSRHHPILPLIAQLTEPLLAPLRRVLPNLGALDLSPMIALLLLLLARVLLAAPLYDLGLALAR